MEVKLENLIEKLRQEGVEEAKRDSEKMLADARKKAEDIIKDLEESLNAI